MSLVVEIDDVRQENAVGAHQLANLLIEFKRRQVEGR
jgi:hypothetical protein